MSKNGRIYHHIGGYVFTEEQIEEIRDLLAERGALGVNAIQQAVLAYMPVSTVDKYLKKCVHFRQNQQRKWDLPHRVNSGIKAETVELMMTQVETALLALKSQFEELSQTADLGISSISVAKKGVNALIAPVAVPKGSKSDYIDPKLVELDKKIKATQTVLKNNMSKCPEKYREALENFDIVEYIIQNGKNAYNSIVGTIGELLTDESDEWPDRMISMIEGYQREAQ